MAALAVACSKAEPPPVKEAPSASASAGVVVDAAPASSAAADPLPAEVPSRQTVRFRAVMAPGAKKGHLILPGFVLERIDVDGGASTRIDVEPPRDCPCGECPPPPPSASAGEREITWDARVYARAPYTTTCDGGQTGSGVKSSAQPAPPGRYRVKLLVATCEGGVAPDGGACRGKMTGARPDAVEFDLPASGDVVVEIK
jgi:hypothetical protein